MINLLRWTAIRLASRVIDLAGLVVGILGLLIAYTAGAQTLNLVVEVPTTLLPLELATLATQILERCLVECFD